ncbi:MBL fold metallo-hydrolase [Pseudomonas sp.]|uniref:MBL fold metallo-hydrolase n=1 Tax=Pseudomonas sp. TaxID=306 RepID=UPI002610B240|nr:MBL fold metallo-hydrolase [Pseudomonas sp.]
MMRFSLMCRLLLASLAVSFASHAAASEPALTLSVFNPGTQAMFPVSSVLVFGGHDAILVDAQFGKTQALQVVETIRNSGKTLTTIYISHGDPDYYFGLDTITTAFPAAKVVASAQTVAHIKKTMVDKLAFWGPKMGADAPSRLVVPEVLAGNSLTLEGHALNVMGLDGKQPDRSFVWIPSIKAVVGGVVVSDNIHVWMADTQTEQSHRYWVNTLNQIASLKPLTVIPGHYLGTTAYSIEAVNFTRDYIKAFDNAAINASDSVGMITSMTKRYPELGEVSSLELSAKVVKGELQW